MIIMNLEAHDVSSTPDAGQVWKKVIDESPDAWIWHSRSTVQFTFDAASSLHPVDLSFFVYEDDKVIGLVPLIVRDGDDERVAAYHPGIGFLPWPACMAGADRERFLDFAFEELESRARNAKATLIRMRYTPPKNMGTEGEYVEKIARKFGYTMIQMESHVVSLGSGFPEVRDRYRRYYKKFSPLFDMRIVHGGDVTVDFADQYRQLHEKDAGRVVRLPESYQRQADAARSDEAFYVVATHKEDRQVAGMLLISLYKQVAYDGSVAIDPSYAELRVGHILKWVAIEELMRRGVTIYELGLRADPATASEKENGISNFKEGWSRGNMRSIWQIEKTL